MTTVDWTAHYDGLYDALGVEAELDIGTAAAIALTVIDKTVGVVIDAMPGTDVQTRRPAAAVRVSELSEKGVARSELRDATIRFNGKLWTIRSTLPKPAPEGGEAGGELWLILKDDS